MVGNPLIVKIIASTIDKTIGTIKNNPQKGVEDLGNLANRFATSPAQKELVKTLESILKNPTSPYYQIIPALVVAVNPLTLKSFILNIGHNSLSHGGRKIKQYKKLYNFNIPWTITFDLRAETPNKLSNSIVQETIGQGQKIGIYTYLVFTHTPNDFIPILKQNPDCAFIIFIPPTSISKENIKEIKSCHNSLFSLSHELATDMTPLQTAFTLLHTNHCLFGSHTYYNNENTDQILKDTWIKEVITPKSPFTFLIQSENCTPANTALIHTYAYKSKLKQEHPTFLLDLYQDISTIDKQLSTTSPLLKILSSGDVALDLANTPSPFNITTTKLLKIISKQA